MLPDSVKSKTVAERKIAQHIMCLISHAQISCYSNLMVGEPFDSRNLPGCGFMCLT